MRRGLPLAVEAVVPVLPMPVFGNVLLGIVVPWKKPSSVSR